jgi:predicted HNH restriction endonuclease
LEFHSAGGPVVPIFRAPGYIDQQTFRGVRRLTSDSARQLDQFLEPVKPLQSLWAPNTEQDDVNTLESFADEKSKFITYYERDRKNRAAAIRIHGYRCKGCDISMEEKYGSHGKDFIHVHHIKPVSQFEMPKEIDPALDLTVLCPNCHAMVHKSRSTTLSIEELRSIIQSVK